MNNIFNGMFGKVSPGMCRLSMDGNIAVKTNKAGYKTYDVKTGRLTNCDNFVFNIGEEFFFVIPTNKVSVGDIILIGGEPNCVISSDKNTITVINYENSTVNTVLKERHMFMGNAYFTGKIVSLFGNDMVKGKNGMNKMLSYMMMSEMMKGNTSTTNMNNLLPLMMLSGNNNMFTNMFENMLDDEDEANDEDETDVEEATEEK